MSKTLTATSPSFIINSKYRDNVDESISNFHYTLDIDTSKNYNCCALTSLRLPKSYYTVESTHLNNYFLLVEDTSNTSIIVPPGNYNVHSMKVVLEDLLNLHSPLGYVYKISYPNYFNETQTFIYRFEVFKNGTTQPSFHFNSDSRLSELLGFDYSTNYYFSDSVLVAPYTVQFELTNYITVKSSICNNVGNKDSDTSVLAQIDCTHVRDGETILYTMTSLEDSSRLITSLTQNTYTFSLYDDKDRPLKLFDDWNMTLLLFEHDYSSSYIINDIKLKHLDDIKEEEVKTDKK